MGTITKGKTASALAAEILAETNDPNGIRMPAAKILNHFDAAIQKLAVARAFRRTEIHIPVVGTPIYQCFAEVQGIHKVFLDNEELDPMNEREARAYIGADWRTTAGTPQGYIPNRLGVRLVAPPDTAGTALTFSASALTEAVGETIEGDEYWCADNAGTKTYFLPGDGNVTNDEDAANNLYIEYFWIPRPCLTTTNIPVRFGEALKAFAKWMVRRESKLPDQQAKGQTDLAIWNAEFNSLAFDPIESAGDGVPRTNIRTEV